MAQAQQAVYISEFMTSNSTIQDPDGEYDDWIELHNPTDHPVDVGGLYLTDDLTVPLRWQFPINHADITTLPPQGYLVVWADNDVNQGPLHATFKLGQSGEQIGLFSSDSTPIDTLTYPAQTTDVSWAFDDKLNQWYAAPYATPGQANAQARGQVVFSEIMYNPSIEGERVEDPNMEFIELFNAGLGAVDLSGWALTGGVSYVFPDQTHLGSGEYLAVALDPEGVRQYYGLTEVYGPWTGGLSNDGETLELADAAGAVVNRLRYADQGDWTQRTLGVRDQNHRGWFWKADHDGQGRSLELVNPLQDNTYGRNWRASLVMDGTPGQANSVADATPVPLIKNVKQSPPLPTSADEVRITATIKLGDATQDGVTLHYRVDQSQYGERDIYPQYDPAAYATVRMRNTGDQTYRASIPAHESGAIIEYFVQAANGSLQSRTWPAPALIDGEEQQVTNALYQVEDDWDHGDPDTLENQPVYYVIMTDMERARLDDIGDGEGGEHNSDAQMNATFISVLGTDIDLRYNVGIRNRGHGSRRHNPNNMRINFR
ncbi:MAG: lamin tail domain-containing protein, partial [Planctomycetes bacterium]|nr:lamin tail domain-containing protein [Planctomycetota bacterium]